MINRKPDHDNRMTITTTTTTTTGEDRAIIPAPAGGALTSLAALGAALNNVDTTSVSRPLGDADAAVQTGR